MSSDTQETGLLLPGLDGANPLGFLAAMGLLRLLSKTDPPLKVTMQWEQSHATWVPRLLGETPWISEEEALLEFLDQELIDSLDNHPITRALETQLATDPNRREGFQQTATDSSRKNNINVAWLAAVGSNATDSDESNQLQTVRKDYFKGNMESLMTNTDRSHLQRSLFAVWDYADPLDNHSLHLNPSEDRRHALQWNKPSGDPLRKVSGGMIGANRLAIEAWPFFPLLPCDQTVRSVGFTGTRSYNTRWTWPLWGCALALPVIRSLLAMSDIQSDSLDQPTAAKLQQRGIIACYRTRRILVGKTPNFTPAQIVA